MSQDKPVLSHSERQAEIDRLKNLCGRCNNPIGQTWESGWPLRGVIDISFASQAFAFLRGRDHIAEPEDFDWWKKGHPAMSVNEAQRVQFSWSNETSWRLCYACQKELLYVIGNFFGINNRALPQAQDAQTGEGKINEPPQAGQEVITAPSQEGHAAGPASGSPDIQQALGEKP